MVADVFTLPEQADNMDLEQLRREFNREGLSRSTLNSDPFVQFGIWLEQAVAGDIADPTAMVLATADSEGQPEQRIVLLKHLDEKGFVFFTNYGSAKAAEIDSNPRVSLLFPWYTLDRQVRVAGLVEKTSVAQSAAYFASRPRKSQLGAWASAQSQRVASRAELEQQFAAAEARFEGQGIPLPEFWGGYRIVPHRFEFWQGRTNRLHDRFEYSRTPAGDWEIHRLAP